MPIHDELELLVALSGAIVVCAFWVRLVGRWDGLWRHAS